MKDDGSFFWVTAYEHSPWNWIVKRRVSLGWNQWNFLSPIHWLLRSSFHSGDAWEGGGARILEMLLENSCIMQKPRNTFIQGNLFRKCLRKKHDPAGLLRIFVQGYINNFGWLEFWPLKVSACFNRSMLPKFWFTYCTMKQREHGNHETVRCVHVFLSLAWIDNLKFVRLNLSTIFCANKYIVQIVRGRQWWMLLGCHSCILLWPWCVFSFLLWLFTWMYCNIA